MGKHATSRGMLGLTPDEAGMSQSKHFDPVDSFVESPNFPRKSRSGDCAPCPRPVENEPAETCRPTLKRLKGSEAKHEADFLA